MLNLESLLVQRKQSHYERARVKKGLKMSQAVLAGSRVTSLTNYYSRALPYTTTLGKFWYLTVSEIKEESDSFLIFYSLS